MVVLDLVRVS